MDDFLKGFEIVASDSVPAISLDNQRRFYINTSARRLMDVEPFDKLSIAYDPSSREIAVLRHYKGARSSELATSNYNVDKRYYMSARHFANYYAFPPEGAPYLFVYDRGKSDGTAFIFKLVD